MPVISSHKDTDTLTLTFVAEFNASVDRVWRVWEDPRQLEKWWGPPSWPATFEQFDFKEGGHVGYHMTGPDGKRSYGWWRIIALDPPHRLEFEDGFANPDGTPDPSLGTTTGVVTLEPLGERTRMTIVSRFESVDQLTQMMQMGMMEGMQLALNQIDDLLV